ncbi:universal stress protein [uncultured Microscilla sp.]|uniref:universal stress protein n=1 Tax=uncultured Microscilla sp. TaxID=432653 RepID=UPI002606262F|nr:universal stress protein [uncultured Microscilla sp.]
MKKILIPTDFSELSEYALHTAEKIATSLGAEIHALKVLPAPGDAYFDDKGNMLNCQDYDMTKFEKERMENEAKIKEWLKDAKVKVHVVVKFGNMIDDIVEYVNVNAMDLVVMGTSGASGWKEMFVGSNAEKVVRYSPVPVLTIKCDKPDWEVEKILLVNDFKEPKVENLTALKTLQKAFEAQIHLLKIEKGKETNREVFQQMEKFTELNQLKNVEFHVESSSKIEEGVFYFAHEHSIDLITMGTHGRTGWDHLIKGSISENLVNHMYKPILTFKLN